MAEHNIAKLSDLPDESARTVVIGERRIALVRTGDIVYAINDRCPHAGGPLGEGTVENGTLRCPWHERHFDPRTGHCVDQERTRSVDCHPVRVNGDDVLVTLPT